MFRGRARRPARAGIILSGLVVCAPLSVGLFAGPASAATGATLSGTVFSDTDGNGHQDSDDPGVASLAVTVTDSGGNPAGSTTTGTGAAAGQWSITGLAAGSYTVTVATPANSTLTTAGQAGGADPASVTVATGQAATPLLTGFRGPDQPPVYGASSNNTAQTVNSGGGLARLTASDPNSDPLSFSTTTPGAFPPGITLQTDGTFSGVATNTTNRTLVYPAVTIVVNDGHGGTASTMLVVTVLTASDTAPTANPDQAHTPPGTAVTIPVLANDTDANGDTLTLTSFSQGSRNSGVNCTAAGQCTFTPASSVTRGGETFTYVVSDGRGASATGTVTVTIDNVKPVFSTAPVNTSQSVPAATPLASVQATDGNGDPVTFSLTSGAASLPPGVTGANPDGSFAGIPTTPGTYHVSIQADDGIAGGGVAAITALTIMVSTPPAIVDNKPVAMPDSYPAAGSPAITPAVPATLNVLANDTDADGDALSIIAFDTPTTGGTVALGPGGTSLVYTPRPGFIATDHFTYTVSDGKPGGTDVGQVTVVVSAPADQPPAFTQAAANSVQTVPSGTALTALSAQDPDTAATLLRYSLSSGVLPVGVTLSPTTGAFTGAPTNAGSADETYSVTVVVSDGTLTNVVPQTLAITVHPQPEVDRAPTPQPDAASTPNGTSVTVDVLRNDTDPDGDPLTISAFDPLSVDGGTVSCTTATGCTYSPAPGTRGDDTFTYTVSDGLLTATATVTVTVGTAKAPVVTALDDTATTVTPNPVSVAVTANDTDSAGYALTANAATQPSHGAVTCSGSGCTYTPAPGFTGDDTFTYTASDDQGGIGTATVAVAVVSATIPTVTANPDVVTTPAGRPIAIAVTANDADSAGLVLAVTPAGLPAHGAATCQAGTCTYTPNAGFSGTDGFTYSAADGNGGTAVGSVVVTVLPPQVPRGKVLTTVVQASPVTITLPVGYHPSVPIGGTLLKVRGSLPPGTVISRTGNFQGVATTAGHYIATVTIRYKGVAVDRKLSVTVLATTFTQPTAQTTEPAPLGTPVLAMTGASGVDTLLGTAAGLLALGAALLACGVRLEPRRRRT